MHKLTDEELNNEMLKLDFRYGSKDIILNATYDYFKLLVDEFYRRKENNEIK